MFLPLEVSFSEKNFRQFFTFFAWSPQGKVFSTFLLFLDENKKELSKTDLFEKSYDHFLA